MPDAPATLPETSGAKTDSPRSLQVFWPFMMVVARLLLAFLSQALVAWVFFWRRTPHPWEAAAPYWTVYGTLIDLGCLVLAVYLLGREGLRLGDILKPDRKRWGNALLEGLGIGLILSLLGLAGGVLGTMAVYKSSTAPLVMGGLPLWAALYSVLIWPVIWGLAEQVTYQGYAFPRIERMTGSPWLSVSVVAFGWALQHIALPFHPDWQFAL